MLGLVESHGGVKVVGLVIFWVVEIFVKALTVFIVVEADASDDASMAADGGAQWE